MADSAAPAAPSAAPAIPVTQSPATVSISMDQGVEALKKLRAAPPAAPAEPVVTQTPPATSEVPVEKDTAEATLYDNLTEDNAEERTDQPVESPDSVVAFTLDDGTSVSVEEAKKGYLRQQDWTQKTQAVSEIRKLAESRVQIVDAAAAFYAERLPYVQRQLQAMIPPAPDESLRQTDPGKYWDQYNDRIRRTGELKQIEVELQQVSQAREEADRLAKQEQFVLESTRLLEKLPSWHNPKVAARERAIIAEYGRSQGYSDAELAACDHRAVLVLRDAALGARVRANNAKNGKTTAQRMVTPTVPAAATNGVNTNAARPNASSASNPAVPRIDPTMSGRQKFAAGVGILAARRAARTGH